MSVATQANLAMEPTKGAAWFVAAKNATRAVCGSSQS
jgi:hypothetical protein